MLYVVVEFPLIAFRSLVSNVYFHFTHITQGIPRGFPLLPRLLKKKYERGGRESLPIFGYIHWYRGRGVSPWDRFQKKMQRTNQLVRFSIGNFNQLCDSSSFSGWNFRVGPDVLKKSQMVEIAWLYTLWFNCRAKSLELVHLVYLVGALTSEISRWNHRKFLGLIQNNSSKRKAIHLFFLCFFFWSQSIHLYPFVHLPKTCLSTIWGCKPEHHHLEVTNCPVSSMTWMKSVRSFFSGFFDSDWKLPEWWYQPVQRSWFI